MPSPESRLASDTDSQRMLATLLGNLPGLVYRCRNDAQWTAEFFSDGTLELTGYPAADFMERRRHFADIIHSEDRARVWAEIQSAIAHRDRFIVNYRIERSDGAVRWLLEQGCGIYGEDGVLVAIEGFITDVTAQQAAASIHRENEERLQMLFGASPVPTWEEDFSLVRQHLQDLGLMGRAAGEIHAFLHDHPEALSACIERVRVLDVNTAAVRLYGATDKAELLSGLDQLITEESRSAVAEQLVAIATHAHEFETDTTVRTLNGEILNVHLRWIVPPGMEAGLKRVVVSTVDITERRRVQDEATLLQSLARGILEADTSDDAIEFVLRHVCETAGWALGEAWAPADSQAHLSCGRIWARDDPKLIEFSRLTREHVFAPGDGLPGTVWASQQPVWIEDVRIAENFPRREAAIQAGLKAALGVPVHAHREVVLVLGFFLEQRRAHDRHFVSVISAAAAQIGLLIERKRATDALAHEQALAASTLQSLPGMFYLYDADGRLVRWNDNFVRATGYSPSELDGRSPYDFLAPEDHTLVRERIAEVFARGSGTVEANLLDRAGNRTPYYFTGVRVDLGNRPHLVGTGFDISELRRSQTHLARNLREFTALHEIGRRLSADLTVAALAESAVQATVAAVQADFVIFFHNSPTGLSRVAAGPHDSSCFHPGAAALCVGECLCGCAADTRKPVYSLDIHADVRCTRTECQCSGVRSFASLPLMFEGELLGVLGVGSATSRSFEDQAPFLQAIAATVSLSLRNAVLYETAQRHATELEREVAGRRHAEAAIRLQASALNAAANAIMITDRTGVIEWVNPAWSRLTGYAMEEVVGKTPRILKSGHQDSAFYERFWKSILAGEIVQGDVVNRRKDGSLYHEHETITPVSDADGNISHFIAIKQDITARLALEEQLRQSQKMDAIGRLAGGIAHDFNNLLTVIQGNTAIARESSLSTEEHAEALREIDRAAERSAALTRQLLAFSRRQVMQVRTLDLNEAVTSTTRMLQRLIGEDIHLQLNLSPRPVFVRADPGMIDQVLMNLAVNARDAMPTGGRLTVTTELRTAQRSGTGSPLQQAILQVSDTGCGIPEEHLSRIFEPFFTTKEPGKGTGLGLATVFGIVKQHNGSIAVSSVVGSGSSFEVSLPLDDAPQTPTTTTAVAQNRQAASGETILVVEDEPSVRRLAVLVLERQGYKVLQASNGEDALKIIESDQAHIDLLLTDMIMPGSLTGAELATRIRSRLPSLKTIIMSGYTGERTHAKQHLQEGFNFLQKPFATDQLALCVRTRLEST